MSDVTLVLSRRVPATLAEVYRAWTDPQIMSQWYAPGDMKVAEIDCEPVVGGNFRVVMEAPNGDRHITTGTYTEIVPGRKLVHSWQWEGSDSQTQVTVEFEAVDSALTELTLTHELFPEKHARDMHQEGWTACLANFEKFVADHATA